MRRIQWGAVGEIILISLVMLFVLAAIIFFSLKLGKHFEMLECLKHSMTVLISLPVIVIFAVSLALE